MQLKCVPNRMGDLFFLCNFDVITSILSLKIQQYCYLICILYKAKSQFGLTLKFNYFEIPNGLMCI